MPFQPGHKRLGGRPKGSLNKDKRLVREIIEAKLGKSIPERLLQISKGNPELEFQVLNGLMPYCYCKLAPIAVPAPLSAEEEALKERQYAELSQHLDDDPNPA